MQMLNPPKTQNPKFLPINPSVHPLSSYSSPSRVSLKPLKFSTISASVMRSQNQGEAQQQLSLAEALLNSNRKDEVLGYIRSSLSNCLSETNLHLTIPGLKSKTRGKVNRRSIHFICMGEYIFKKKRLSLFSRR